MADTKLSALTELAAAPAADDELYIRDISEAASAESKRITITNIQKLVANLDLNGFNIAFPSTQVADAGANVLDDYEEGTFTPTIQDASRSDSESQTYTTQVGRYQKIGNRVYIYTNITINSLGTLTGSDAVVIAGLPFTTANIADVEPGFHVTHGASLAITSGTNVVGRSSNNVTVISLAIWSEVVGDTSMTVDNLSAAGQLICNGFYEV